MEKRLPASVIEGLKSGDATSFNIVYASYRALLFFIIVSIVKNEEDAKDVLQDTFIKIYENAISLKDNDKFHAWASGIAKNLALNKLKTRQREVELSDDLLEVIGREDETFHFLQDWNVALTDAENAIIAYKIVYDYTFQEIAQFLGTPLSTVYKIYGEALKKLKQSYQKEVKP